MSRDITIDIAKGIGIILVVVGHLSSPISDSSALAATRDFVYQFHIPLFFFLSGLFIKDAEKWLPFLNKKAHRLYLPFLVANLTFFAIHIIAHVLNGEQIILIDTLKHAVKIALGIAITPLGGATWFLMTLFWAHVLHKVISSFCANDYVCRAAFFLTGILGVILVHNTYLSRIFVASMFLDLGYSYTKFGIKNILKTSKSLRFVALILSTIGLFLLSRINAVDVSQGQYGVLPLFILSSILGIYWVLLSSNLLIEASFLATVGRASIWILIGHFLSFRLVTFLQMMLNSAPFDALFSHPCYMLNGLYPLVYLLAGVTLPLLFKAIIDKICLRFHS